MRLEGTAPGGAGINEQKVNKEGQALTFAIIQTELEHESEENSQSYNWSSGTVSIDAGDTVLLVKNTSEANLHIEYMRINNGSTPSGYTLHLPTTEVTVTAGGGGAVVTGTNLNTGGKGNVADAVAASDETNNAQGNILETPYLAADANANIFTPGVILGKNKSLAVDVTLTVTEAAVTMVGHYED